jgi:hypothetical protein
MRCPHSDGGIWKITSSIFYFLVENTTPGKKYSSIVFYCFDVNMARFGNINADEFTSFFFFYMYLQNEILCTMNIIVFPLGNSFLIT